MFLTSLGLGSSSTNQSRTCKWPQVCQRNTFYTGPPRIGNGGPRRTPNHIVSPYCADMTWTNILHQVSKKNSRPEATEAEAVQGRPCRQAHAFRNEQARDEWYGTLKSVAMLPWRHQSENVLWEFVVWADYMCTQSSWWRVDANALSAQVCYRVEGCYMSVLVLFPFWPFCWLMGVVFPPHVARVCPWTVIVFGAWVLHMNPHDSSCQTFLINGSEENVFFATNVEY